MSKIFIEESTLTSIGDAIREKTGKSELISPLDMPTEIEGIQTGGGGEYFTDEDLTFTGDVTGLFSYDKWKSVLEREKRRIKITKVNNLSYFLRNSTGTDYSFLTIEGGTSAVPASNMFYELPNIEKFPVFKNVIINSNQCSTMLSYLYNFNDIDELIKFFDSIQFSDTSIQSLNLFSYCYSLRNIDAVMPYLKKAFSNYNRGVMYRGFLQRADATDEVNNLPIPKGTSTSDYFYGAFSEAGRLKNITFETNNGVPFVVQWKKQVIDLTFNLGTGTVNPAYKSKLFQYKSGITADKEVIDDATYQALKNDADWFTCNANYSRYNHDSAVNTINSLPDTSEYLTTQSGATNTIKFKGAAGAKTDGGAINTLTDEEIAVAAAKGWTVTLI